MKEGRKSMTPEICTHCGQEIGVVWKLSDALMLEKDRIAHILSLLPSDKHWGDRTTVHHTEINKIAECARITKDHLAAMEEKDRGIAELKASLESWRKSTAHHIETSHQLSRLTALVNDDERALKGIDEYRNHTEYVWMRKAINDYRAMLKEEIK